MMQIGLIGLSAGVAAALLFASVMSGTMLSIPLAYLTPLPIMIAGLGWSHWAALIAALSASAAIGVYLGGIFMVAFLTGVGLPAWWLGYLAMLARPAVGGGNGAAPAALEWYPPGRLVVWSAVLGATLVLISIATVGADAEGFNAALRKVVEEILRMAAAEGGPNAPATLRNPQQLIDLMVIIIPPGTAVMATVTNVVNLWLAASIVKFSGRLTRPWPDVAAMTFPHMVAVALVLAVALSFVGGMVGLFAGVVTAALLMAYGMLGLAVLLSVTQGTKARGFIIAAVIVAVIFFRWPILALCLLGLIDTVLDLRTRAARRRGPPARL
ncbi:MAG: DUF2232 domain-containing protein [Bradyrhizobium sp.]